MRVRILLVTVLVLILAGLAAVIWLGWSPPDPQTKPVERVLPNDRFPGR